MTNYSLLPRVSLLFNHAAQGIKSMSQCIIFVNQYHPYPQFNLSCITHDESTTYYEVLPVLIVIIREVQTLRNLQQ